MEELFFSLIQFSLGVRDGLSRVPSDSEWKSLFQMARRQSVCGICFCGVSALRHCESRYAANLGAELYLKWTGTATKILQKNELLNRRCVELQSRVRADGFNCFIMKGQGNAALYGPELCGLRQPGDIDIFLEGGYGRVMRYVNGTFPSRKVNELEINYPCFADATVEVHYLPFIMRNPVRNRRLQAFFAAELEACFKNEIELPGTDGKISVPTARFNIVHQAVHVCHHFFTEGVGLRQLLDFRFVLLNSSVEDRSEAFDELKKLGLGRFCKALMWVLGQVFSLEEEFYLARPCVGDGRFLLREIMFTGNFGVGDSRRRTAADNRWKGFWLTHLKTFRLGRFDPWAWFWSPIWRIDKFVWRKMKGYD